MTGYTTGTGNRTTTDGTWTYTYDAAGDVVKKSKGMMSDTWVYTYDNNNEMVTAAESATDGGAATQRVTYAYDALGNRISSQQWNGSTTTTTRYGLDGWDTAQPAATGNENFVTWVDLDGSNTLTARRLFGADFGAPLAIEAFEERNGKEVELGFITPCEIGIQNPDGVKAKFNGVADTEKLWRAI